MKHFFILALGRSGTSFLAELLAADRRGVVHHEPYEDDLKLHGNRYAGRFDTVVDRWLERRFERLLPAAGQAAFYGEVNSYLRYHVDWLRDRFEPTFVHLVRDGRDFVRSAWIRKVYTPLEYGGPIVPGDDDPYASAWGGMDRFERLCWYWAHTNDWLARRIERRLRFEQLLADYDALDAAVLRPTGVRIDRATWAREVARPRNTSRAYRFRQRLKNRLLRRDLQTRRDPLPHWSDWNAERTERFWEICGATMARVGYERGGGRKASLPRR